MKGGEKEDRPYLIGWLCHLLEAFLSTYPLKESSVLMVRWNDNILYTRLIGSIDQRG